MSQKDALSPKQQRAILVILESRHVRDAARELQMSERQLYRWMDNPLFAAELKKTSDNLIADATRRLAALSHVAIDTILEVLKSKATRPSVKVRGGAVLLSQMTKLRELNELEERIANLEKSTGVLR